MSKLSIRNLSGISGARAISIAPYLDSKTSQEIIQVAAQIHARYTESPDGIVEFAPAPTRLTPWTGDLYWNPETAKLPIEGISYINSTAPLPPGGILNNQAIGFNAYEVHGQIVNWMNVSTGTTLPGSTASPTERTIRIYDPGPWMIDLQGNRGITLRGGAAGGYFRYKSFNDFTTNPYIKPLTTAVATHYTIPSLNMRWSSIGGLDRNKLLAVLGAISADQTSFFENLEYLCSIWRFSLASRQSDIARPAVSAGKDSYLRILNEDCLSFIKIALQEVKNHYPLNIPINYLTDSGSETTTTLWNRYDVYGGLSGGYRRFGPIGATLDLDPFIGSGVSYDTWSPLGPTADQGEYLFDAWKRRSFLSSLYLLEGITTTTNPYGISGGQLLSDDPSWNLLFKQLRNLLFREIRDTLIHIWEGRPWYINNSPEGRSVNFSGDIDNLGWVVSNQFLDPLAYSLLSTMYLYPFAKTELEKKALLASYNVFTEYFAGFLERALWNVTPQHAETAGCWPEGFAYASQSLPAVLNVLIDTKRMGDRRLWDTVSKRGAGVTYSCWANTIWKWCLSRQMPGCAPINIGSSPINDTTGGLGNGYHWNGWPHDHWAILASENPVPGTTGSAISDCYNIWPSDSGFSLRGRTVSFYKIWQYLNKTINKPQRQWTGNGYFPGDGTITWFSEFLIPNLQDDRFNRRQFTQCCVSPTKGQTTGITGPLIFGLWISGGSKFNGKNDRHEGQISAYMGNAPILIETGEIRDLLNASNARKLVEKGVPGHSIMQLGQMFQGVDPKPALMSGITLGPTGGSVFMDSTFAYNTRSLTAASGLFFNGKDQGFQTSNRPWGYNALNEITFYQYQISKVTRGISWSFEPKNPVSSYIKITDFVGISGICGGASGPTERIYYKWHLGTPGNTTGIYDGFTLNFVPGTNKKVWYAGWTAGITYNSIGGFTCSFAGTTMTISADQPIEISRIISSNYSTKNAVNTSIEANTLKNYVLDIRLGLSGGAVHDETKLNLITEVQTTVFKDNSPLIIP